MELEYILSTFDIDPNNLRKLTKAKYSITDEPTLAKNTYDQIISESLNEDTGISQLTRTLALNNRGNLYLRTNTHAHLAVGDFEKVYRENGWPEIAKTWTGLMILNLQSDSCLRLAEAYSNLKAMNSEHKIMLNSLAFQQYRSSIAAKQKEMESIPFLGRIPGTNVLEMFDKIRTLKGATELFIDKENYNYLMATYVNFANIHNSASLFSLSIEDNQSANMFASAGVKFIDELWSIEPHIMGHDEEKELAPFRSNKALQFYMKKLLLNKGLSIAATDDHAGAYEIFSSIGDFEGNLYSARAAIHLGDKKKINSPLSNCNKQTWQISKFK